MLKTFFRKLKHFMFKPRPLAKAPLVVFLVGLLVVAGIFAFARPAEAGLIDWAADTIAKTIAYVLLWMASILGKILVVIIDILIGISTYNGFGSAPAIEKGWIIVRDVCNMFFVIVLLIIAFGTILRIENYKYNRLLAKLVMMAVLVNFSKLIALFFIDLGQVVMLTFVNAFANTAAGNFTTIFHLKEMLQMTPDLGTSGLTKALTEVSNPSRTEIIGVPFLAVVMLLIAIMVMLAMVVVLLVRIVVLWILVVLSPLAYLLSVMPMGQRYSSQWWSTFGKWVTTGPILAFFVWLSMTVLIAQGAGQLGLASKDTSGQSAFTVAEGGEIVSGTVAATISNVSTSENILSFILAIGMLMIALSMASALGGVAGSFAGRMAGRIKGMGAGALRVAGAPFRGAYQVAEFGVKRGAGFVGRKLRESRAAFLTPEYWKGFFKRGERLGEEAKLLAGGRGEYRAERVFEPKGAALDRMEMARRNIVNTKKSEFQKELGRAGESRQAMQDLSLRAFYARGHEGNMRKQAFLELATEKGNLDDVYFAFGEMYRQDDTKKAEIRQAFGQQLGYKEEDVDKMFDKYNANSIRQFSTSFLGLRKDLVTGGKAAGTADNVSEEDQNRLRALAGLSESSKDVGHWEQFMATRDAKTGKYYMMDEPDRRAEIVGEAKKRGLRNFLSTVSPHVFREREWAAIRDENGNLIEDEEDGDYVEGQHVRNADGSFKTDAEGNHLERDITGQEVKAKKYKFDYTASHEAAEEGSAEHEMFTKLLSGQHLPELRQMQSRIPDQIIGKYFDDLGNFVDTEEEAIERGFQKIFQRDADGTIMTNEAGNAIVERTALENMHENFDHLYESNEEIVRGMWKWKYLGKVDAEPKEDRNERLPWQAGYRRVNKATELDEFQSVLGENIRYQEVETAAGQYEGLTERQILEIKEKLTDAELAGRFGMIPRENIMARADAMNLKVDWDVNKAKGGREEVVVALQQRAGNLDEELSGLRGRQRTAKTEEEREKLGKEISDKEQQRNKVRKALDTFQGDWAEETKGTASRVGELIGKEAEADLRKALGEILKNSSLNEAQKTELTDRLMEVGRGKPVVKESEKRAEQIAEEVLKVKPAREIPVIEEGRPVEEQRREYVEKEVKAAQARGTPPEKARAEAGRVFDEAARTSGRGERVTGEREAAARQTAEQQAAEREQSAVERMSQELVALIQAKSTGSADDRRKAEADLAGLVASVGKVIFRDPTRLNKQISSLPEEQKRTIQAEVDKLNEQHNLNPGYYSTEVGEKVPGEGVIDNPGVGQSLKGMSEFSKDLQETLESTKGVIKDFPELAKEMSESLENLIKSVDKASSGLKDKEKEMADQFTKMAEETRNQATRGQITGFPNNPLEQHKLLWQMIQLTNAMKDRRNQVTSGVLDKARREEAQQEREVDRQEEKGRPRQGRRTGGQRGPQPRRGAPPSEENDLKID